MMRFLLLAVMLLPLSAHAQERAVGGSLQTEASWSALKSMVERTDGNVAVLKIDVDAMKACGAQKKIWTGTQCVNADMVDSIIACGDLGQIYDKSANACVQASVSVPSPTCRTVATATATSGYMGNTLSAAWCSDGIKSMTTPPHNVGGRDGYEVSTWTCYKVICN